MDVQPWACRQVSVWRGALVMPTSPVAGPHCPHVRPAAVARVGGAYATVRREMLPPVRVARWYDLKSGLT